MLEHQLTSADFASNATLSPEASPMAAKNKKVDVKDWKALLGDLDAELETYEGKALQTIALHEQDFLIAYQGHMKKVYEDLDKLRKKAHENNFILRRD